MGHRLAMCFSPFRLIGGVGSDIRISPCSKAGLCLVLTG
jgi:hypothetical protein